VLRWRVTHCSPRRRSTLEDDLRNAVQAKDVAGVKTGMDSINGARKAGKITPDEQVKLTNDAYKFKTRLAATIVRLPLDDALDVYNAASNVEKKQIRAAVLGRWTSFPAMIPTNGFSLLPSHTGLMYVYFPSPVLILSSTPTRPFRAIIHPCSYTTEANAKRLFWATWVQSVTRRNGFSIP
jgi:hypothetical protein